MEALMETTLQLIHAIGCLRIPFCQVLTVEVNNNTLTTDVLTFVICFEVVIEKFFFEAGN
jgi:hypothetical protein